jgi:hypothetical protein
METFVFFSKNVLILFVYFPKSYPILLLGFLFLAAEVSGLAKDLWERADTHVDAAAVKNDVLGRLQGDEPAKREAIRQARYDFFN